MPVPMANRITDELVQRIGAIQGGDAYPFSISDVLRGVFYEDLPDDVALPVATVVPGGSAGSQGQQMPANAQRARQYQVEVVFDFDDYPGRSRDEVMTNVEWSLCKALGGPLNNRALGGLAISLLVGEVEYGWPLPSHTVGSLRAAVTATYVEHFQ